MIFQGKTITCQEGNSAVFVCTSSTCTGSLFFCSQNCPCFTPHGSQCSFKNIQQLSNGIESLLKRNFRKDLKGDSIEVVARAARQTRSVPGNSPFCLTYCDLDFGKNYDMEIRVKKLVGCVGVGALHRPTVLKHGFQFIPNQDYIQHGAYMILSNGYQYSHSDQAHNFLEYRGISLQQGSQVRISTVGNELVFQQQCKQVRIPLPEGEAGDLVYGVYLYNEGDQVEVLVKE